GTASKRLAIRRSGCCFLSRARLPDRAWLGTTVVAASTRDQTGGLARKRIRADQRYVTGRVLAALLLQNETFIRVSRLGFVIASSFLLAISWSSATNPSVQEAALA